MTGTSKTEWNELQFSTLREFRHMAPTILQLEIRRAERLIRSVPVEAVFYNSLVRGRFAMEMAVEHLNKESGKLDDACAGHLRAAIMCFSLQPDDLDERSRETCAYIVNRLNYVHYRIGLIY